MIDLSFDLKRLIHPVTPETFREQHWENKPLVVAREQPDYYDGLLSLSDVDRILASTSIQSPLVRVLHKGKETPISRLLASGRGNVLEALYHEYRGGSTIALQFLHERSEPLKRLCHSLAEEFSATFQVNAYLTPPREQGLAPHYDTHDVFVLQTAGMKRWRIFEASVRLPLPGQPGTRQVLDSGTPLAEFELKPGDAVYIPRGYPHYAVSVDSVSLHLTVGIQTVTWAHVLLGAMEAAILRESRFRECLPLGFARDARKREDAAARLGQLLDEFEHCTDTTSIIDDAVELVRRGRHASLDGHLLDLEAAPTIDSGTRVQRRREIVWSMELDGQAVLLYFHGKVVRFPNFVEDDVRFITEAEAFSAQDLPGRLDDAGRLVLIRRLLSEGFLTIRR